MTYELITERNVSAGVHVLFVYVNDVTGGLFMNVFLAVIFLAVTFGIYLTNKRTTFNSDFAGSLAAGSFVTFVICVLLKLIPGLVNNFTFVVVLMLLFISVMIFLFSER